jgi:surface polysaccharide O-acyltransferase-like enzyme
MSVDVLYLIGVSLPLVYLALRMSGAARWTIIAVIFLFTPILQQILGYADYPTEVALSHDPSDAVDATSIFNHWLLDGWFPLFPWLGFALLGAELADLRVRQTVRNLGWIRGALATGLGIFGCGVLIWWLYPGDLLTRGGYSELFYPPTPGFIITAVGLAMMLLATIDWNPGLALYRPLRLLGESALLMYLLHIVLIKYVVAPEWEDAPLETFMVLYAGMVVGLLLVAYAGRGVKARWHHLPLPVRVLLGN